MFICLLICMCHKIFIVSPVAQTGVFIEQVFWTSIKMASCFEFWRNRTRPVSQRWSFMDKIRQGTHNKKNTNLTQDETGGIISLPACGTKSMQLDPRRSTGNLFRCGKCSPVTFGVKAQHFFTFTKVCLGDKLYYKDDMTIYQMAGERGICSAI